MPQQLKPLSHLLQQFETARSQGLISEYQFSHGRAVLTVTFCPNSLHKLPLMQLQDHLRDVYGAKGVIWQNSGTVLTMEVNLPRTIL